VPLCPKCGNRIAKRDCRALGSRICSLCCGRLREKELHCPASCPHLARHRPYQDRKNMLRGPAGGNAAGQTSEDDVLRDERLAWLVLQLEAPVAAFAGPDPSLTDGRALSAFEYAREKVDKGKGLIIIPGESRRPGNELGEAVYDAAEKARWESAAVLTSGRESYGRDEKLRCLDRVLRTVRLMARGRPEGRAYVSDLAARFARLREAGRPGRLIPG